MYQEFKLGLLTIFCVNTVNCVVQFFAFIFFIESIGTLETLNKIKC